MAVFGWHSSFKSGPVSVEDDELSGQPSISKPTANVDKFENLSTKTVAEESRKFEHAPHCREVCSPALD
jgi:hypothetical protein